MFEKEMQRESVFLDRNVLSASFIPDILPYREAEIGRITQALAPALNGKVVHNIFIYGTTGVGKTAVTKHVLENLLATAKKHAVAVECIYLNCHFCSSKYQIMLKIAEECSPGENLVGLPHSTLFERILKHVTEKNESIIIVLDEIDKIKTLDDLMYSLTRANDELKQGHLSIIGITNNAAFKEDLDPRSKSTLCEEELVFAPYNAQQLQAILEQRVELGFKPGGIDESAINLTAALAAQESGDARYALKLMLKAGEIADTEMVKRITDSQVNKARKTVEEDIIFEVIRTLPEHQKIVLSAITLLSSEGSKYARLEGTEEEKVLFSGEVYEKYLSLCKQRGKSPRSARWCREYINDLEMLGLLTTTLSGKGVRGNTTLIRLSVPAPQIKAVLERENAA